MPKMHSIPSDLFPIGDFVASIKPENMVYFLCNVGDGDAQLILLPENPVNGKRQAIIVDAARKDKLPWLIDDLEASSLLPPAIKPDEDKYPDPDTSIPLVIGTHPHRDHILGMEYLLHSNRHRISEYWDPGYYLPTSSYLKVMAEVERNPYLQYAQPASGFRKWIGDAVLTVMAPSIQLRNRFDTYGTNINDSSISLRIEFPASRVVQRDGGRSLIENPETMSLLLGADSQTLSWSYLLTDFPYLSASGSEAAKAIKAARGKDLLNSDIMKVSHHCSKRGVNLELMERVSPRVTLISSVGGGGQHSFPHGVAQEIIREALDPVAKSGKAHKKDWELGIFFTSDRDTNDIELGSIALVLGTRGIRMWRFEDSKDDRIDFGKGRRMK
ncbi:MAG: hypothetical protein KAR40_04935 [Candidatus Sabulitectum sp.]|nr:hypothetical protein [Candidatus Sabulitectum sp.]